MAFSDNRLNLPTWFPGLLACLSCHLFLLSGLATATFVRDSCDAANCFQNAKVPTGRRHPPVFQRPAFLHRDDYTSSNSQLLRLSALPEVPDVSMAAMLEPRSLFQVSDGAFFQDASKALGSMAYGFKVDVFPGTEFNMIADNTVDLSSRFNLGDSTLLPTLIFLTSIAWVVSRSEKSTGTNKLRYDGTNVAFGLDTRRSGTVTIESSKPEGDAKKSLRTDFVETGEIMMPEEGDKIAAKENVPAPEERGKNVPKEDVAAIISNAAADPTPVLGSESIILKVMSALFTNVSHAVSALRRETILEDASLESDHQETNDAESPSLSSHPVETESAILNGWKVARKAIERGFAGLKKRR
jgi:hypothetical protein